MNSISYMQKATEVAAANGQVFKSIFDVTVAAMQRLTSLNGDLVRSLTRDGALPTAGQDVRERLRTYTARIDETGEYVRECNDLCIKTQMEIARLHMQRMGDVVQALTTQFEELARINPMDTSGMGEALKVMFNNSGSAYEEMTNTMREAVESSLTATLRALQPPQKETPKSPATAKKAA
ncbi:MAG: hypothetical protein HYS20_01540 [Rhodocyclales bacterium]|nr:hypothetical protein [Rhodocyclales bacterium]